MMKRKAQNEKRKVKTQSLKLLVLSFSFALYVLSFALTCYAAIVSKSLKQGNRLYRENKLDEALQKYNDANVALPDSDIINFNIGAALYKKEDYQKAIDAFTKSLTSEDKNLEVDALYNLGNSKYKLGKLKENTDLSTTVALLRESVDYYKRAVEIDQKNTDARFNYEFVERELKVLLDKLKQQQSNQDKQKEQEQQQEQPKQGSDEQGVSAEEAEQQEESFDSAQDRQSRELSEEGARALLERYGQGEAMPDYLSADRQDIDRRTRGYEREVLKDW